jgi:hypothetical protein
LADLALVRDELPLFLNKEHMLISTGCLYLYHVINTVETLLLEKVAYPLFIVDKEDPAF